jgi:hypothetical protein
MGGNEIKCLKSTLLAAAPPKERETVLSFLRDAKSSRADKFRRRQLSEVSECRYCGKEISYERSNSAIVPLPPGTATAAH